MESSNKKKGIIIALIGAVLLILTLGVTYAFWNYSKTGENQQLIAGDIYMHFKENNQLTMENAMPSAEPGENYFEFTISGKNTYNKPIHYEINLQHGDNDSTRTERIKDNLLMFRLVEIKEEQEETVLDKVNYNDLTNKRIWVDTIDANTNEEVIITYRLYMWISDKTIIGNTDDAIYSIDTWNNQVYASIKVYVKGDFAEKRLETGTEVIKSTLGKEGGVIGVTNDSSKVDIESDSIREYRYSGLNVNNYVYFNCKPNEEQNATNCEEWRIVGVFKDESNEEHLKIVKDKVLTADMFPATYTISGIEYKIKYTGSGDYAYWNNKTGYNNDWATAGLQYWLNTDKDEKNVPGYLSKLKEETKGMIADTKYYLGTVKYFKDTDVNVQGIWDTPKEAYANERAVNGCEDEVGPTENNSQTAVEANTSCRVWADNSATWTGKVGLLYPSDYGFSAESTYWGTKLGNGSFDNGASNTSWLQQIANHSSFEWLLSPASGSKFNASGWYLPGFVSNRRVDDGEDSIRPVLNLKSGVSIVRGAGTLADPYQLG